MKTALPVLWNFAPGNVVNVDDEDVFAQGTAIGRYWRKAGYRTAKDDSLLPAAVIRYADTLAKLASASDNCLSYWFGRYERRLAGYCRGLGISRHGALAVQSEIASGCQTAVSRDNNTGSIWFFHLEEAFEDQDIIKAHELSENRFRKSGGKFHSDQRAGTGAYRYRIIRTSSGRSRKIYFSYPGMMSGGNTFGYDGRAGVFHLVDSLFVRNPDAAGLHANIVLQILFDIGSVREIRTFLHHLSRAGIRTDEAYAVHLISDTAGLSGIISLETGGGHNLWVVPSPGPAGETLVQANYPRSRILRSLRSICPEAGRNAYLNVYRFWEMRYREKRLRSLVQHEGQRVLKSRDPLLTIRKMLATPYADYQDHNPEGAFFTGLVTMSLAAYCCGIIRSGGETAWAIGKYAPPPWKDLPYRRRYDPDDPVSRKIRLENISEIARRHLTT